MKPKANTSRERITFRARMKNRKTIQSNQTRVEEQQTRPTIIEENDQFVRPTVFEVDEQGIPADDSQTEEDTANPVTTFEGIRFVDSTVITSNKGDIYKI